MTGDQTYWAVYYPDGTLVGGTVDHSAHFAEVNFATGAAARNMSDWDEAEAKGYRYISVNVVPV